MFDAVARTFEGDDIGVMDDPVDHCRGDGGLTEDLSPSRKRQVRGENDRGLLVSGRDQLEEQVSGLGVEWDVADLVDLSRCRDKLTYADPVTMPTLSGLLNEGPG